MNRLKELSVPAGAHTAAEAEEVLRAWIVDGGLHVSLRRAFDDPATWGILLVDIARHAARIFAREGVCSEAEALDAVHSMFEAEWNRPTDLGTTHSQQ
ncbi:MAG: DUF5076 domain-containing protein [Bauldia sp.]|nr:DUF5076 domain-containing protein [Bauldia sp.]